MGFWRSVGGRAAFDDVGDEEISAGEGSSLQNMVEIAPGITDEGTAGLIFLLAWAFADDHHFGGRFAFAWHGAGARSVQRTLSADADAFGELLEAFNDWR